MTKVYEFQKGDILVGLNFSRQDLLILIGDLLTLVSKSKSPDSEVVIVTAARLREGKGRIHGHRCPAYNGKGIADLILKNPDGSVISAAMNLRNNEDFTSSLIHLLVEKGFRIADLSGEDNEDN